MKNLFNFKWLLLCIVLSIASVSQIWAEPREFDGSTKFYYTNIVPLGWGSTKWAQDSNRKMFICLKKGETETWCTPVLEAGSTEYSEGALYSITPPKGTYDYYIMTRAGATGWDYTDGNKTGNIGFHSDASYNWAVDGYSVNGTGTNWGKITPKSVTSDGTGVLYFNGAPSSASWWSGYGADRQFAYFFNNTSGTWSSKSVSVTGNYYKVTVPSGTWTGVILTRHNDGTTVPSWDNKCNQTADIPFVEGHNYLSNFQEDYSHNSGSGGIKHTWGDFIRTGTTVLNGTMNDWSLITAKAFSGGELKIPLPAHKTMSFKIVEGDDGSGDWYGLTDANCILSNMTDWEFSSSGKNTRINTAGEGTYTFNYNASHQLSVTYPNVTHPNVDYIYLVYYSDAWSDPRIHFNSASTTYGISGTTWTGQELTISSGESTITDTYTYETNNTSQVYFYCAVGDYPQFNFNDNGDTRQTDDQTPELGKRMYHNGTSWVWATFDYKVTLNTNEGVINEGNVTSYTWNVGATLPSNVTKVGYSFGGWFDNEGLIGSAVTSITASETGDKEYWAKWNPVALTFNPTSSTDWGTRGNWSPACVPTIEHAVTLLKPVIVAEEHATAKSIVIDKSTGHSGKLTIQANSGLEVAGTIQKTTNGGSTYGPTAEEDLVLESSSAGNASLIFNNNNACQATVYLYSKATIDESWNWQYVGTPFTGSIPLYNYYGSWMYKWVFGSGWVAVTGGEELDPFAGYCLTQSTATTHEMGGTLIETTSRATDFSHTFTETNQSVVLANSWTAPIYIGAFTTEGEGATFTSTPATIYLFNTGSAVGGSSAADEEKEERYEPGKYIAIPIYTGPVLGDSLIAPMQGFFITTTGGTAGTVKLNYEQLVRPTEGRSNIIAGQMHAPKKENRPNVLKIWAEGTKYNDRVVILEREDFTTGFDNGWDGEKLNFGVESPSVFVINEPGKYDAVSAIPAFEGTKVGFRAGTDTECTIRFEYKGEEALYLDDLKDKKSIQIGDENTYTFTTSAEDDEARFVISKMPMQPTGIEDVNYELNARKQLVDGTLYIIRDGKTYNAEGAMIK